MFGLIVLSVGYAAIATLTTAETVLLAISDLMIVLSGYTFGMIFGRVLRTHGYI